MTAFFELSNLRLFLCSPPPPCTKSGLAMQTSSWFLVAHNLLYNLNTDRKRRVFIVMRCLGVSVTIAKILTFLIDTAHIKKILQM